MKLVFALFLLGLVRAQNVIRAISASEATSSQPKDTNSGLLVFPLANGNPIQRLVERLGGRAQEDSTLLKRKSNQMISRAQKILGEVRNISVIIEKRAKNDIRRIRARISKLLEQREKIELEINELSQSIGIRSDEFKNEIQKQKDRIENHFKSISNNETEIRHEFENEIKRLGHVLHEFDSSGSLDKSSTIESTTSKSMTASHNSSASPESKNQTMIVPQVRGLGDGYGRHL